MFLVLPINSVEVDFFPSSGYSLQTFGNPGYMLISVFESLCQTVYEYCFAVTKACRGYLGVGGAGYASRQVY